MKKIFTLISMAFVAMSVNAQIWKAAEFDVSTAVVTDLSEGIYGAGTETAPDTSVPLTIKTSTITVEVDGLTMTGVSTPNSLSHKDEAEGKSLVYWELKGKDDGSDNLALTTDLCTPQFTQYLMPAGNPGFQHWEYYEINSDGDEVFRAKDTYWEIGATSMPAKGAYYKFAATKSGSLRVAIYGNKNTNPTYIVDESTKQPIAPSSVDVKIYYQNTTFAYEEGKFFNEGKMADDYVLQHTNGVTQNRPVLGYIDWDVEAGKTYWLFNPMSQIGIYGFYFAAGGADGIANVKAELDADAPVYNLAGQKVSKDYKGVKVQNGRKFVSK
ncbi:MAG: hypothetical protein II822_08280 [Prevotella sp.]|nr:hypothetical protein [Prevotella sp.]